MHHPPSSRPRWLTRFLRHPLVDLAVFGAAAAMTFLTFAKESVLYQNHPEGWRQMIYLFSTRAYYPASFLIFLALLLIAWHRRGTGSRSVFYRTACVLLCLNLALASSNNVINLLRGRPLHRVHKGVGW